MNTRSRSYAREGQGLEHPNPLDDPRCVAFELKLHGEDVPTVRRWLVALVSRGHDQAEALVTAVRRVVLRSPAVRDDYPHLAARLGDLLTLYPAVWLGYAGWAIEVWAPLSEPARGVAVDVRWKALRARLEVQRG